MISHAKNMCIWTIHLLRSQNFPKNVTFLTHWYAHVRTRNSFLENFAYVLNYWFHTSFRIYCKRNKKFQSLNTFIFLIPCIDTLSLPVKNAERKKTMVTKKTKRNFKFQIPKVYLRCYQTSVLELFSKTIAKIKNS